MMRRCVRDRVFLLVLVIGLSIRTFVQLREGNDEWRRNDQDWKPNDVMLGSWSFQHSLVVRHYWEISRLGPTWQL